MLSRVEGTGTMRMNQIPYSRDRGSSTKKRSSPSSGKATGRVRVRLPPHLCARTRAPLSTAVQFSISGPQPIHLGCRFEGIKLGDSTLPQSPVEGGSWIATSVANGIMITAGAIREDLLRLAKQMPDFPLANASPEHVTPPACQPARQGGSVVDA